MPANAESRWKPSNWNLKLTAMDGQKSDILCNEAVIADGEFIADFQLLKSAKLDGPCAGFCVRGSAEPLVIIGRGSAPIVFGADKVNLGHWYCLHLTLTGEKAFATLTEPQDKNPQVIEATAELAASGAVGIADFGATVTFANFFVRDAK